MNVRNNESRPDNESHSSVKTAFDVNSPYILDRISVLVGDHVELENECIDLDNFSASGKGVAGCVSVNRDIMVSYILGKEKEFNDLFLTTEQAETFLEELKNRPIGVKHNDYLIHYECPAEKVTLRLTDKVVNYVIEELTKKLKYNPIVKLLRF